METRIERNLMTVVYLMDCVRSGIVSGSHAAKFGELNIRTACERKIRKRLTVVLQITGYFLFNEKK